MNARDRLAELLGPQALIELDECVAAAPPLPDAVRAELAAIVADALTEQPPGNVRAA